LAIGLPFDDNALQSTGSDHGIRERRNTIATFKIQKDTLVSQTDKTAKPE